MSLKLFAWAFNVRGLAPIERLVLCVMAEESKEIASNEWLPWDNTSAHLASRLEITEDEAFEAMFQLEQKGFIELNEGGGGWNLLAAEEELTF